MKLLFLDFETTGTDFANDQVIDVGALLVSEDLDTVYGSFSGTAFFDSKDLSKVDDFVVNMHTVNGLWTQSAESTLTVGDLEQSLVELVQEHRVDGEVVYLAGSGVSHFDKHVIDAQMPELSSLLSYATYDFGVLRRCLSSFSSREVPKLPASSGDAKTHRGYDDALAHLQEARMMRDFINERNA